MMFQWSNQALLQVHPTPKRGNGLAVEPTSRNPENLGSIPRLGSRRSSLIGIEHAEFEFEFVYSLLNMHAVLQ